jgi:hypothetical protein
VSVGDPVIRLSSRRWLGRDPGERIIAISYSERDGLWRVRFEEEIDERLDADLRGAVSEAADTDADEPWIVELADEIEHDLNRRGRRT